MPQDLLPEPSPLPGGIRIVPADDVFEHYRIFRREDGSLWELGRGAMGVTYKAIDTKLDKPVALKIINSQLLGKDTTQKRFRREARAAASLHHRNIASVHYLGETGGGFFYAMEYVDGETIEEIVKRDGPLPWKKALAITLQISRALMAAHAKNLVHRDIKPANIMLVDEVDEQGVAKLIDFGLAKSAAEEAAASNVVTNASGFLGTPLYASPEQCEEVVADIRSDIYSLGITLWFMLTGHPTFQGNVARVFHQQLHAPPPLEQLPADLPLSARTLLEKMLAKDRNERPQTPTELRVEIEACLQAPVGDSVRPALRDPASVANRQSLPVASVETKRLSGVTLTGPVLETGSERPPSQPWGRHGGKETSVLDQVPTQKPRLARAWLLVGLAVVVSIGVLGKRMLDRSQTRRSGATLSWDAQRSEVQPAQSDGLVGTPALASLSTAKPGTSEIPGPPPPVPTPSSAALVAARAARAKAYLSKALGDTIRLTDADSKASAFREIAAAQAKAGDVSGALSTAQGITEPDSKASALREIAAAQAEAGDQVGSQQSFAAALNTAQNITEADERATVFREIAAAQVKARDMWGAISTTRDYITNAVSHASALVEIAAAQAKAGDQVGSQQSFAAALSTALDYIPGLGDKASALVEIAAAQAKAGDVSGALSTTRDITEPDYNARALVAIAAAQAKIGDVSAALSTARDITFAFSKAAALREIAAVQAEAGDRVILP